jgi:hypothetical protein
LSQQFYQDGRKYRNECKENQEKLRICLISRNRDIKQIQNDTGGINLSTEYVVAGAALKCTMGVSSSQLAVMPTRRVILSGKKMANIGDCVPFVNVPPFGGCKVTSPPKPCTPACAMWIGGKVDVHIHGMPALLDNSFTVCPAGGGTITISDSGQ